jgi:hypothetical protein
MTLTITALAFVLLAIVAQPAHGQDAPADPPSPAPEGEPPAENEIIVTAPRERGTVIGRSVPDVRLGREEIATYGAGSVGELLTTLRPQTGEAPVVLVNGRRIAGSNEVSRLPPEAIERVEILPPEVALAYGYRADQRVVNIVLENRFQAVTAEAEAAFATAGGRDEQKVSLNFTRTRGSERLSLDLDYARASALHAAERGLSGPGGLFDPAGNIAGLGPGGEIDPALSALAGGAVTVAGAPAAAATAAPQLADFLVTANRPHRAGDGRYRTLLPRTRSFALGATLARPVFDDINATFNARYAEESSTSAFGLPASLLTIPAGSPFSPFAEEVALYRAVDTFGALTGSSESGTGQLGLGLNGSLAQWNWSFTASYDRSRAVQHTDTGLDDAMLVALIAARDLATNPFGPVAAPLVSAGPPDRTRTASEAAVADVVTTGSVARLPAGNVTTTFAAGLASRSSESTGKRAGLVQQTRLSADTARLRATMTLPIASRRNEVLAPLGDLSLNVTVGHERLSQVGAATNLDLGTTWSPIRPLRLSATYSRNEDLPPIGQRADPIVETANVPVFDFTTGETVQATRLEGGNPALLASSRNVLSLLAHLRPLPDRNVGLNLTYSRSTTRNAVGLLPAATPEIEAAFPERFVRDGEGRLVRVDLRPVNFARGSQQRLGWSLFAALPFGGSPARAPSAADETDEEAETERGEGLRGAPNAGGRGRMVLSLSHNWSLRDRLTIRDGLEPLDFLAGDAFGGRGRARHQVSGGVNLMMAGLGASLTANWQSGSRLRGGATDLSFSDLATVDVRLFADLGRRPELAAVHWLRGTRLNVGITNLFDSRVQVRDALGVTPAGFEGAWQDPLGRAIRVGIRKQL